MRLRDGPKQPGEDPTTGTLGILRDAAADGLVDLGSAFAKL
ncbi:MAG: hypothetical protein ABSB15_07325 [Bryobacteraceae bacterium]|jgi:hypothetical protein